MILSQSLADQFLGLVVLCNAGEDLAVGAGAVIQGEAQQLVGLLNALAVLDLHSAEVGLAEGIEVNLLLGIGLDFQSGQLFLCLGCVVSVDLFHLLGHIQAGEQDLPS